MKAKAQLFLIALISVSMVSCVSKKKFLGLQSELEVANAELAKCGEDLNKYINQYEDCVNERNKLKNDYNTAQTNITHKDEQLNDLRQQVQDYRKKLDKTFDQVSDLTDLNQSASDNIKETLQRLQQKEEYINMLREAKSKTDSLNLALAVNLKGVLSQGIADKDIEVQVDKAVVFINLSDKMVFRSGSAVITSTAESVLGKIAAIIKSRPDLEVMVEGYTDDVPIRTDCIYDNWDLSVKRATSVVRALESKHGVASDRLIAAGRGENHAIASNDTSTGRALNRRTRIIILPKINQFYDLLDPAKDPSNK